MRKHRSRPLQPARAVLHDAAGARRDRLGARSIALRRRASSTGGSRPIPSRASLEATDGALCLGVSVLTGTPIRDALAVTRAVRGARGPRCRIVWGGWHPSLFPVETLTEAGVDAVVVGQGEDTFAELVDRFAAGESAHGVAGCVTRDERPARPISIRRAPRATSTSFPRTTTA